jgi:hypothetical protein
MAEPAVGIQFDSSPSGALGPNNFSVIITPSFHVFSLYSTNSISPGRQVCSIQGSSGPYIRKTAIQLLPGMVCSQLFFLPLGVFDAWTHASMHLAIHGDFWQSMVMARSLMRSNTFRNCSATCKAILTHARIQVGSFWPVPSTLACPNRFPSLWRAAVAFWCCCRPAWMNCVHFRPHLPTYFLFFGKGLIPESTTAKSQPTSGWRITPPHTCNVTSAKSSTLETFKSFPGS